MCSALRGTARTRSSFKTVGPLRIGARGICSGERLGAEGYSFARSVRLIRQKGISRGAARRSENPALRFRESARACVCVGVLLFGGQLAEPKSRVKA